MEIDMTYQLKVIQQSLEQEEAEHKATKARLADKNKIYESIEEAKSEAMKGMLFSKTVFPHIVLRIDSVVNSLILKNIFFIFYCQIVGTGEKKNIRKALYAYHFFPLWQQSFLRDSKAQTQITQPNLRIREKLIFQGYQ